MATSFLLNLTYPERTAFRVGIVNVGAGTGLLISASGAPPTAEVVTGADNFLWAEAARQVRKPADDGRVSFMVERAKLDERSCPGISERLESFYAELGEVMAAPINLSKPTSEKYERRGAEGEVLIAIDGTSYIIQLVTSVATIRISPDNGSDTPLHRTTGELHSYLAGCSNGVTPAVEQHYF